MPVLEDARWNDEVLFLGCAEAGLVKLQGLSALGYGPAKHRFSRPHTPYVEAQAAELAERANFLVFESRCQSRFLAARAEEGRFPVRVTAKGFELYVK